jgi:hypothetical protein
MATLRYHSKIVEPVSGGSTHEEIGLLIIISKGGDAL